MSNAHTEHNKSTRVQVRLPEALMMQVKYRTSEQGLYADASDYLRSLIRRDMESETQDFMMKLIKSLTSPTRKMEDDFFDKKLKMLDDL